jgi:hypothetical protein
MATKPVRKGLSAAGWIRSLLWQEFQRPLGGLLFGSAATHADAAGLEAEAGDLALDLEFLLVSLATGIGEGIFGQRHAPALQPFLQGGLRVLEGAGRVELAMDDA